MAEIELWIDQRERHVIPYFDSLDYKKIPPYKIELRTLSAGDYAVVYKDHIIMLIERKSWQDLAATFLDRSRKFNYEKMISERNKFGCYLFYLIEGKRPHGNIHHVAIETLEAHLDHLYFDHQIVSLYSESAEKTPERILRLIKHYMTTHSGLFKALEEKLADANNLLSLGAAPVVTCAGTAPKDPNCVIDFTVIPEINDSKLSAADSLKAPKRLSDDAIKYAMWNCIEGVTEANYIALTDINASLQGLLLGQYTVPQLMHAKYRLGTSVGEKKLSKIIASAICSATHIKVLSQIPSISENKIRVVLSKYKLADIITGLVTENQLADIIIPAASANVTNAGSAPAAPAAPAPAASSEMEFGDDLLAITPLPNVGAKASALLGLADKPTIKGRRLGNAAAKNIIKYIVPKDK
jgi:hypothetical protein